MAPSTSIGPPGPPAQWPEWVAVRLRGVMAFARARLPLSRDDTEFLGHFVIAPNLVHWVLKLQKTEPARSYSSECPVYGNAQSCQHAALLTPSSVPETTREDLCRLASAVQPWSLQVSLLWNSYLRAQQYGQQLGSPVRPSHACAADVFRGITDNAAVQVRWTSIVSRARPAAVERKRDDLVNALDTVLRWPSAVVWTDVPELLDSKDIAELAAKLCEEVSRTLDDWTSKQVAVSNSLRDRIDKVVKALLQQMTKCLRSQSPFPTRKFPTEVADFLELLSTLNCPGRDEAAVLLEDSQMPPLSQRALAAYIQDTVLPRRNEGLPPGDPLDDPVLQDIFWYRVGPSQFDSTDWARSRWQPVGPLGKEQPAWRVP